MTEGYIFVTKDNKTAQGYAHGGIGRELRTLILSGEASDKSAEEILKLAIIREHPETDFEKDKGTEYEVTVTDGKYVNRGVYVAVDFDQKLFFDEHGALNWNNQGVEGWKEANLGLIPAKRDEETIEQLRRAVDETSTLDLTEKQTLFKKLDSIWI